MKTYFIHDGKEQLGPFTIEQLKTKGISRKTMIWFEGMDSWKEAQSIDELKDLILTTPPPFEKQNQVNETFEKAKKVLDKDIVNEIEGSINSDKKKKIFKWALIILALIGLVVVVKYVYNGISSNKGMNINLTSTKKSNPLDSIAIIKESGYVHRSYYTGDVEIRISSEMLNKSNTSYYKDFIIEVEFLSQTNTKLETRQYTIYQSIEPLEKKYFSSTLGGSAPDGCQRLKWKLIGATEYKKKEGDNKE